MTDYLEVARRTLRTAPVSPDANEPGEAEPAKLEDEPEGIPWAEWKAAALNRLFREQGVTGRPGRITAATVRHSLESSCNGSVE
jgi:hypothetical protein